MDVGQIVESTSGGKIGSALFTIIIAGFLWVGKTTFEHVGQIAGIRHEIDSSQQSDTALRRQYDEIVSMLNERTKSRFTREDAEKLTLHIKEVEETHHALKDLFLRDYTSLKIEIANVASKSASSPSASGRTLAAPPLFQSSVAAAQQIEQLEAEIASLQSQLVHIQRHVGFVRGGQSSAFDPPRAVVAQPNLDRTNSMRR